VHRQSNGGTLLSAASPFAISTDALEHHVRRLCAVGPRFVGTEGERLARLLIADELAAAGLEHVREEPVPALAYRPADASLIVLASRVEVPVAGLQFTAAASASGPGVYLGELRSEDQVRELEARGVALQGTVAVFHSIYPYLVLPFLIGRGVRAAVVISDAPGTLISGYTAQLYPPAAPPDFEGRPLPIPGVIVSSVAARQLLLELSLGGTELSVAHLAGYYPIETANVVGLLPGRLPDKRVVVGAHYDTQLECPGACDNASGVAALVEIAAAAARGPQPLRTIVFAAFADEEHGCVGSTAYCVAHRDELDSTLAMVNLDALGWAHPGRRALYSDPAIRDLAFATAERVGWTPEEELEASLFPGSDYNPFIDAGVPAAFYWRYPPGHPYYHTAGDVPELLDIAVVGETATVAASLVHRLANDDPLNLGRSRPSRRWLELRPQADGGRSSAKAVGE
jgi:peptidase M28-like protein